MARPRKKRNYRSIHVSGLDFCWCHEIWDRPYCLVVVLDGSTSARGQRLIVERCAGAPPEDHTPALDLPVFRACRRAKELLASEEATPGFVAAIIQFALKHGWQPKDRGIDFTIRYYESGYAEVVS